MSAVPEPGSSLTHTPIEEQRRIVCATDDLDVYRDTVNDVYYPARLELVGAGTRLSNARMSAFRLTDLTIGIVRFGAEVSIDPGDMGGYHVDLPLSGPSQPAAVSKNSLPRQPVRRCTARGSGPSSSPGARTPPRSASKLIALHLKANLPAFWVGRWIDESASILVLT